MSPFLLALAKHSSRHCLHFPSPRRTNCSVCFAVGAIESDPVFSRENQYFQTQNERYEAAVRKAVHLQTKMHEMGWTKDGPEYKYIYR